MSGLLLPKPIRELKGERSRIRAVSKSESRRQELLAESKCSDLTRLRARGRCELSGKRGTEAHHGFGKQSHPSVRFDGRNLFWLTREMHERAHREPDWFHEQMRSILGKHQYEALKERAVRTREQDDPRDVLEAARRGEFLEPRA